MFQSMKSIAFMLFMLLVGPALFLGPGTWRWIEDLIGPTFDECRRDENTWRSTGIKELWSWQVAMCGSRFGTYGRDSG
jgi:hypothetical protein